MRKQPSSAGFEKALEIVRRQKEEEAKASNMRDLITGDFPCPFCGDVMAPSPGEGYLECIVGEYRGQRSISAAIAVCEKAGYRVEKKDMRTWDEMQQELPYGNPY